MGQKQHLFKKLALKDSMFTTKIKKPLLFSALLVVVFLVLAIVQQNYEFLLYAGVLLVLVYLLHATDHLFGYKKVALWGFAIWILLHLLGGFASINGVRLYDYMILSIVGEPYNILKYDQFVHLFCYGVMGLLMTSIVDTIATQKTNHWVLGVVAVLAAIGVGSLNEVIEFATVVLFESTGVGGYTNTAIDLVTNLIGAIIGVVVFFKLER